MILFLPRIYAAVSLEDGCFALSTNRKRPQNEINYLSDVHFPGMLKCWFLLSELKIFALCIGPFLELLNLLWFFKLLLIS